MASFGELKAFPSPFASSISLVAQYVPKIISNLELITKSLLPGLRTFFLADITSSASFCASTEIGK